MWYDDFLDNPEAEADYDAYLAGLYENLMEEAAAEQVYREMVEQQEPPVPNDEIPW